MMDYEIYKELAIEQIRDYLPEELKKAEITTQQVTKVNQVKDALMIRDTTEGMAIIPTLYLDDMYTIYEERQDFAESLRWAVDLYMTALKEREEMRPHLDLENAKDQIFFQLINKEQNEELLEGLPHRDFEDLAVIYRLQINVPGGPQGSALVNQGLAENMGLTEDDLFRLAMENTKRLYPVSVRSMQEVIRDIMAGNGMDPDVMDMMMGDVTMEDPMYVISNREGVFGAASILYEEELFRLAERLEDNLYILPSSIHEVIAIKESMGRPEELAIMVSEINRDVLDKKDRLSDQVYHYDKEARKVSLATELPDKKLDDAEIKIPDAITR